MNSREVVAHVGDLAEKVASDYIERYESSITQEELAIDREGPMLKDERTGLFTKIDFRWRPSDRKLLDAIRGAVDKTFAEMYSGAFGVINEFYSSVRVQETIGGKPKFDSDNRPVWVKKDGKIVEDWSNLKLEDITKAIFHIQKLKFEIADQQSQLLTEAILAKHAEDDVRNEAWLNVIDGTQGDRAAKASRESLADKYHAYFRYTLYVRSQAFMREVDNFLRLLEKLRYWMSHDGT